MIEYCPCTLAWFFFPEVSSLYSLEKEEVDPSLSPISLKKIHKKVCGGFFVGESSEKSESEKGDLWGRCVVNNSEHFF